MIKQNITKVPYFSYLLDAWDSNIERINLCYENIENLLRRLEFGEKLFEVIPSFLGKKKIN